MAEEVASPINQVEPKPILRKIGEAPVASTISLKPVTREAPVTEPPPVRETLTEKEEGNAISRLKGLTQKLKSVTQEIPAQAILHRTGIIASQTAASESQAQAAKSKTMRISLTEALGAALPSDEAAASPMKTIRIKRPVDLPRPVEQAAAGAAEAKPVADTAPTMTQRRTLRIARPGNLNSGAHLKLRRPGAPAAPVKMEATEPAAESAVADIPEIADLPTTTPLAPVAAASTEAPTFVTILSLVVQIAACALMGFVGWTLFQSYSMLAQ